MELAIKTLLQGISDKEDGEKNQVPHGHEVTKLVEKLPKRSKSAIDQSVEKRLKDLNEDTTWVGLDGYISKHGPYLDSASEHRYGLEQEETFYSHARFGMSFFTSGTGGLFQVSSRGGVHWDGPTVLITCWLEIMRQAYPLRWPDNSPYAQKPLWNESKRDAYELLEETKRMWFG